jgi:hypothetical protein
VSKFLFVCSDLQHDTPTTSVRACTGLRGEPADVFPWEILLEKLLFLLSLIWPLPLPFFLKIGQN